MENTNKDDDLLKEIESLDIEPAENIALPDASSEPSLSPFIEPDVKKEDNILSKYLDKMDIVTNEVLVSCKADRQEAQQIIDLFLSKINAATAAPPSRMYVDGLVKAIEVKSNINMTAVKIMDTNAKMIAATKAGIVINNNTQVNHSNELTDILNSAPTDEA